MTATTETPRLSDAECLRRMNDLRRAAASHAEADRRANEALIAAVDDETITCIVDLVLAKRILTAAEIEAVRVPASARFSQSWQPTIVRYLTAPPESPEGRALAAALGRDQEAAS